LDADDGTAAAPNTHGSARTSSTFMTLNDLMVFSLWHTARNNLCLVLAPDDVVDFEGDVTPNTTGVMHRGTSGTDPPLYEIHTLLRSLMAFQSCCRTCVNRERS
jgi:hypothetical protein